MPLEVKDLLHFYEFNYLYYADKSITIILKKGSVPFLSEKKNLSVPTMIMFLTQSGGLVLRSTEKTMSQQFLTGHPKLIFLRLIVRTYQGILKGEVSLYR